MADEAPDETEISYADALSELETILDRLERDEPDVDRIVTDVGRAAELVQICRERISVAQLKVSEVVEGMVDSDDDSDESTSG